MLVKARFIPLLIMGLVVGCHPANKLKKSNKDDLAEPLNVLHEIKDKTAGSKIVFLTFEITETDSTKEAYNFRLINKIFSNGTLKKSPFPSIPAYEQNHFYCELSSADNQRIGLIKTDDPLNRVFEFPGEEKDLGKQVIRRPSGQFTIRFQFDKNIKFLSIFKLSNNNPKLLKKIYYAAL